MTRSNPDELLMTSTLHQAAPRLLRRTPPPLIVDSPPRPSSSTTLTSVSFATTHCCSHVCWFDGLGCRIAQPQSPWLPPLSSPWRAHCSAAPAELVCAKHSP